jgi:hypothetical protein
MEGDSLLLCLLELGRSMLIEDLKNAKAINTLNAPKRLSLLAQFMKRKNQEHMCSWQECSTKGAWSDMWKNTFSGPYCAHLRLAQ